MRWAFVIVCLIVPAAIIQPDSHGSQASVEYTGLETVDADPGEIISFAYTVRNNTTDTIQLTADLVIPEKWKLLLFNRSISLEASARDLYLASIHIPHEAKAGQYTITGRIVDTDGEGEVGSFSFIVVVSQYIEIQIEAGESPAYMIAGQEANISISIVNKSNVDVRVGTSLTSSERYLVEIADLDGENQLISAQDEKQFATILYTDPDISKHVRHSLRVFAYVIDGDQQTHRTTKTITTEIFPKIGVSGDRFNRIPIDIDVSQSNSFDPDWQGRTGASISVEGFLDESKIHSVELALNKQIDLPPETFFRKDDVIRLRYWSKYGEFIAGDTNYELSSLCASCQACQQACPVNVISDGRVTDSEACLANFKHMTGDEKLLWCRVCIEACPVGKS